MQTPETPPTQNLYEALGGESALRAVINRFVDLMFEDLMIGFFFRNADRARIKEMEFQLAAQMLGGPVRYHGKPLTSAHRPHRIMGGQFNRRTQILKDVMATEGVPDQVRTAWLGHVEALRAQITGDASGECIGR